MNKKLLPLLLSAVAVQAFAAYDLNFASDAILTNTNGRATTSVTMAVEGLSEQTLPVGQDADKLLYHNFDTKAFLAIPDKEITVAFGTTFKEWMNGYVWVDLNNDGTYDPATERLTASSGSMINPPAFRLPAATAPGVYHARFIVDWDSNDPGGSTTAGNDILKNGGSITDAMIVVEGSAMNVSVSNENCASVLSTDADGNTVIDVTPNDGYVFECVEAVGGYDFAGLEPVNPALSSSTTVIYGAMVGNSNRVVIPASNIMGDYTITVKAVKGQTAGNGYDVTHAKPLAEGETLGAVSVNAKVQKFDAQPGRGYFRATGTEPVLARANFEVTYSGTEGQKVNFLFDRNQDGQFTESDGSLSNEKIAGTAVGATYAATFIAPTDKGVYRGRVEVEGSYTADYFVSVHNGVANIDYQVMNGQARTADKVALAPTTPVGERIILQVIPTLPGFECDSVIVRHGQNLNGPELVNGNPQWADFKVARGATSGRTVIPASVVDGDVMIYAIFKESPNSEWTKIWGDEFNDTKLNTAKWKYQDRSNALWACRIAQTAKGRKEVNLFGDGTYTALAKAYDGEGENDENFISGAINSADKFSVKYGKIEARLRTDMHSGSFPAFWMMPAESTVADHQIDGKSFNTWPINGEIDIWEMVNTQPRAHHTIHSGWGNWSTDLNAAATWAPGTPWPAPKQNSPAKTSNNAVNYDSWIVFALEWDEEELRWYVDGELKFTYANQHYVEEGSDYYFEDVTWPFNKKFYIILNQSCGKQGGWASAPDKSFTYRTKFDYVRVYQKKENGGEHVSVAKDNGDDPDFYVPAAGMPGLETSIENIEMTPDFDGPAAVYDLNGRRVTGSPAPGVYIERSGSKARKILMR